MATLVKRSMLQHSTDSDEFGAPFRAITMHGLVRQFAERKAVLASAREVPTAAVLRGYEVVGARVRALRVMGSRAAEKPVMKGELSHKEFIALSMGNKSHSEFRA